MNPDDPKLTAYALDELDPAERAEIEQLLRDDPAALQEMEATMAFAAQLRSELKAEPGTPLTDAQRIAVLESKAPLPEMAEIPSETPARRWAMSPLAWAAGIAVLATVGASMKFTSGHLGSVEDLSPEIRDQIHDEKQVTANPRVAVRNTPAPKALTISGSSAEADAHPFSANGKIEAPAPLIVSTAPAQIDQAFKRSFVASGSLTPQKETGLYQADSVSRIRTDSTGELAIAGGTITLSKPPASALNEAPADPAPTEITGGPAVFGGQIVAAAPAPLTMSAAPTKAYSSWIKGDLGVGVTSDHTSRRLVLENQGAISQSGKDAAKNTPPQGLASGSAAPAQMSAYTSSVPSALAMSVAPEAKAQIAGYTDSPGTALASAKSRSATPFADGFANDDEWRGARDRGGFNTETYDAITDNAFLAVQGNPLSTFSIDVDTASYANVRRFLNQQSRPPKDAVRIEELLNYFTYDYPQPEGDAPFSATMEVATCPWAPEHRLVRIGLKGREIQAEKRPASNLVFLIDVSGSMMPPDRLPLLKKCLSLLVDKLSPEDTVSIAVYAGASGTVLEPTHDKREIRAALDRLESGGSTNGAAGIQLAYRLAENSFIKGGVNRVILATDGDFNVGVTNQGELTSLIERKAKSGVFLTVLGFGMGNLKDSTLEKLADKGNGNYAYIDTLNEGRKVLVEQINGTLVTIAKDVKIQVEFNPAQASSYRLIGYENRLLAKEDFNDDRKDAGEIGAGHTVTALYEVVPRGAGVGSTPAVDPLKYQNGKQKPGDGTENPTLPAPSTEPAQRSTTKPGSATGEAEAAPSTPVAEASKELLTLKLRYKQPDGDKSKLLEFPLTDRGETWEKSSKDFRFAAAVAGYGMLLRESPHKGSATWESVRELAMEGRGEDHSGYRGEFLTLIDKARSFER